MDTKTCSYCKTEKPRSEYQMRRASKDGLTHSCKTCLAKRDAKRYPKERYRRKLLMQAYMQTDAGKKSHSASSKKWREFNQVRRAAHVILGNALRRGTIRKSPCFICGNNAEAHHPDYDRPLDVMWLCPKHHKEAHALVANNP